ncbi:unnamed protein product [Gongylonema pulchrum]|uniref:Helicase ATP-binding domain-containing protein n=1 Tax=Gongylonema pulchrum TaxID=637853 RepID=A0A183DZR0_9BILA|nr:unnamed protein product [Gongylonema pulchrum]
MCVFSSDNVREKQLKRKRKAVNDDFFDNATSSSAVTACGFNEPTRIQSACIPVALAGRDICACAATGTGKTAAFMLPILERLLFRPQKAMTRVIVLTPTRELAIQIFSVEYLF